MGGCFELDKQAGLQGERGTKEENKDYFDSFRDMRKIPTKIGWMHTWGMMKWGKKAGPWGQGPQGLDQRTDRKRGPDK